jgi:oxygen-independent coproporphyrinogen-3 oxidase
MTETKTNKKAPPLAEPVAGNYFVAAYPPFFYWNEQGAEPVVEALGRPAAEPGGTPLGLYIHIPFCEKRCEFCCYLSYDDQPRQVEQYLGALTRELALYSRTPALAGRRPSFVYIGGGTPSLLSTSQAVKLVSWLQNLLPWSEAREVTFELAPRSVTPRKAQALRDAGVTRVSLGVQELDDDILERNGRVHLVADVEKAYEILQEAGFQVMNVDLLAGLLGQTDDSFLRSLEGIIEMEPESVTIYQMEIPFHSRLYQSVSNGRLEEEPPDWAEKRERVGRGLARLEEAGYSVRSGYSAVRDPERHRFLYEEEQYHGADILGIGASSFSYVNGLHFQNAGSLTGYLEALSRDELPIQRSHSLTREERLVREFILQLKLGQVSRGRFNSKFGVDVLRRFEHPLLRLVRKDYVRIQKDTISATRAGLLRIDRLLPSFYLPDHQGARFF